MTCINIIITKPSYIRIVCVNIEIMTDMIYQVKEGTWKAMIVDQQSLRILSSCIRLSDITSQGITSRSQNESV